MIIISYSVIIIGCVFLINQLIISTFNNNRPKNKYKMNPSICILIPARDESKVIEKLLYSISKQTHKINMKDVYVIVEDQNDKTIEISKSYGNNVLFRNNLKHKKKGYALDEGIKQIKSIYDLYFIFDADNILDDKYIEKMLNSYYKGYDIGIGYRNSKNGNTNIITACSTLTFSMINQLFNNLKLKHTNNITISGTGFFIRGEYIRKWKGYPFHSLTEDYELTLYSILHSMTSDYNKEAIFYDEQPTTMNVSINQRTRWVAGFFEARRKYIPIIKKSLSYNDKNKGSKINSIHVIRSIIAIIIGVVLFILINLFNSINCFIKNGVILNKYLMMILVIFLFLYIILQLFTLLILTKEQSKLNLNFIMKIKTIFFNPIFLMTYLVCIYKIFINKNIGWTKIEHNTNVIKK